MFSEVMSLAQNLPSCSIYTMGTGKPYKSRLLSSLCLVGKPGQHCYPNPQMLSPCTEAQEQSKGAVGGFKNYLGDQRADREWN